MRAGVPVVPIAFVGAEEAMPILYKSNRLARLTGIPYVPLTANRVTGIVSRGGSIMAGWFTGVTPSGPNPIPVYVTRLTGGANNTGDIRLKPNGNSPNELRAYLISEVTESFMQGQNKGWGFLPGAGATNENS